MTCSVAGEKAERFRNWRWNTGLFVSWFLFSQRSLRQGQPLKGGRGVDGVREGGHLALDSRTVNSLRYSIGWLGIAECLGAHCGAGICI